MQNWKYIGIMWKTILDISVVNVHKKIKQKNIICIAFRISSLIYGSFDV